MLSGILTWNPRKPSIFQGIRTNPWLYGENSLRNSSPFRSEAPPLAQSLDRRCAPPTTLLGVKSLEESTCSSGYGSQDCRWAAIRLLLTCCRGVRVTCARLGWQKLFIELLLTPARACAHAIHVRNVIWAAKTDLRGRYVYLRILHLFTALNEGLVWVNSDFSW